MFTKYTTLESSNHSQPRVAAVMSCQNNLMAASWHMPISKSPYRYIVAVRDENYTHALLEKYGSFSLNFLPFGYQETVDMTGRFHGNEYDKLIHSNLEIEGKDANGNILLSASDFIYECKVCDTYCNGDHTVFIADVIFIHMNEKLSHTPLLFLGKGNYTTIQPPVQIKRGQS